jgi:acyl-coenzyme A synthetase/AMP-(fatty) acid ligase
MSGQGGTAPIWTPDPAWAAAAAITRFAAAAGRRAGLDLSAYDDLLAWSVRDLDGFWGSIADFFDLGLGAGTVLADARMPGASWFPGARLNYAAQALRHGPDPARAAEVAVTAVGESGDTTALTWAQLRAAVGAFACTLRGLGVMPGDRVAGYLPNVAETVIAFLATASIGAVWSACAQDYAAAGAAARFAQLAPVVLVAADGYRWNGRALDRRAEVTELRRLWRVAADHQAAVLGVSPGYLAASARAGLHPGAELDLRSLRTLGVTGAPLTAAPYAWVRDRVGPHVQTASTSGGTDVASGFAGSSPITPVWAGEISAPMLGVALESWDDHGRPRTGQVGELVVTRPMPSMPLGFWDDPDGKRYRDAYFATWPGTWRHGDWVEITDRGSVIVTGRSDATLNRHGVRLGSADIYTAIEALPEIQDSLVIGAELGDGDYWLVLFVVLAEDTELTEELAAAITTRIRAQTSPRHVPDDVIAVPVLPHTRTGKRLEVPVKRLIQGHPLDEVAGADAVDDYAALAQFSAHSGGQGRSRRQ